MASKEVVKEESSEEDIDEFDVDADLFSGLHSTSEE